MATQTMTMIMLKRAYAIYSSAKGDQSELRDSARNGMVVFRGTDRQCYAKAKKMGLTYSK